MFVLAFQSVLTSLIGRIFTSVENRKNNFNLRKLCCKV